MCARFFIGFQREDCGHKRGDNEEEKGWEVAWRHNVCAQRVVADSLQMAIPNCKSLSQDIFFLQLSKRLFLSWFLNFL